MPHFEHGITEIVWVPDLGATPARVNRKTGVMYLNTRLAKDFNKDYWYFIMLHEMAHVVLQTTDEIEADNWAFEQYAKSGHSLTAGVKALTQVLNDKDPEHAMRMYLQLERAKRYDFEVNKNNKVYQNAITG